ncbi:hypothetical protein CMI37_08030 [Candidatus Pacearchaeota archaeon]|nr:hypothetical protein [Candidatus Pacearchaeota archaeon]|tara:strand:+ start:10630 stop:10917 length:288 start_codon:yes stop_codon:yes gene_type:complete
MGENKSTQEGIPVITEDTVKEHIENIEKSIEDGTFKLNSNKLLEIILKENPELVRKIISVSLESDKSEEWKAGYLAGVATLYDILKRQGSKSKSV